MALRQAQGGPGQVLEEQTRYELAVINESLEAEVTRLRAENVAQRMVIEKLREALRREAADLSRMGDDHKADLNVRAQAAWAVAEQVEALLAPDAFEAVLS